MSMAQRFGFAALIGAVALVSGCSQSGNDSNAGTPESNSDSSGSQTTERQSYTVGVIAKAQANPVFQAARTGAFDAARDLSEQYGIDVTIEWRTPNTEDAQKQAEFVELLTSQGVDGIAISCSDANLLTSSIDSAVTSGVDVCTFDSDAPDSKRFAYFGVDDFQAGKKVMEELAGVMGGQGVVAILSGNPNAANLSARVNGVREQAKQYPDIEVRDVYYEPRETATDMAAKMQQVQTSEPDISGWALVGGWPLYTDNALDGIYEHAKIVSMDPLPLPLEYVRKGQVQVLVGQPYYDWGYKSVEIIINRRHNGVSPESELVFAPFDIVTADNVEEFAKNWDKWLAGSEGGN